MKKGAKLMCILTLITALTGCGNMKGDSSMNTNINDYKQISMEEAVVLMEKESNYMILDVRTPEEYAEKHIPDALNIPNETIGKEEITMLPDKNQMIMVYCRSGNRSKQAAEKLCTLGYTNIIEFGGIIDWSGEIVSDTISQ